jgi:hypothetical protein
MKQLQSGEISEDEAVRRLSKLTEVRLSLRDLVGLSVR